MKALIVTGLLAVTVIASAHGLTVVDVTRFGGKPDSGQDATPAVKAALEEVARLAGRPCVLSFPKGRYDFWATNALKFHCGLTAVHQQWDFIAGLHLNGLKHVTVEGHGSELLFHARMTPIFINNCEDIEIRNLNIDHKRPTISEFTVKDMTDSSIDAEIHPDSTYEIKDGKFRWVGADGDLWSPQPKLYQAYDPGRDVTWRCGFNLGVRAEQLAPRLVRFHFNGHRPAAEKGFVFQSRDDGIRKQQGSVVNLSKNVRWRDVNLYFCTGLGIVGQLSENLSFRGVNIEPRKGSGRTCASFADGIHCCNCSGKVVIEDCRIVGTQDDPVNVYGDDLIVKAREKPGQLLLSYSEWELCGYLMLFTGDEVVLLRKQTLQPFARRKVVSAELLDKMTQRVVLDGEVPEDCVGHVAENRTRMPEILIRGCYFARTPTRGVLTSSWRKTVIERNTFYRTQMAAYLANCGDHPYYLQGPVENLTIRNNTFIECVGNICLYPEQPTVNRDAPVHKNVTITGNRFVINNDRTVLWAKSTRNLRFTGNRIEVARPGLPLVWLWGSSAVNLTGNTLVGEPTGRVEIADYEPQLLTNGTIKTDRVWNIVKGNQRGGMK